MTEEVIRAREELQEQINALHELKEMAAKYGYDISVRRKMQRKLSSGSTLHTSVLLKNKTARQ